MRFLSLLFAAALLAGPSFAQERPASPRGEVSTQVGGAYVDGDYEGGKWVVIDYGRPILRGRTGLFGSGATYGDAIKANAPV